MVDATAGGRAAVGFIKVLGSVVMVTAVRFCIPIVIAAGPSDVEIPPVLGSNSSKVGVIAEDESDESTGGIRLATVLGSLNTSALTRKH